MHVYVFQSERTFLLFLFLCFPDVSAWSTVAVDVHSREIVYCSNLTNVGNSLVVGCLLGCWFGEE
jgi:hypothetical protein